MLGPTNDHVDWFANQIQRMLGNNTNVTAAGYHNGGHHGHAFNLTGHHRWGIHHLFSQSQNHSLNALVGTFSNETLAQIQAELGDLSRLYEPDYVAHVHTYQIYMQPTPPSWGLWRTSEWYSRSRPYYYSKTSGAGVDVWTIDTGVNAANSDFYGRAENVISYVTTESDLTDTNGHGTHVAGTIGSWTYGVAKRCNIKAVKVLDVNGTGVFSPWNIKNVPVGYYSWIISGIQYATQRVRPGKTVINLSLGGDKSQAVDGNSSQKI